MKSGKVIDVSKSSLISLKAELVRKQEEAEKARGSDHFVRPLPKKKIELKVNPGIEERKLRDEVTQEEVDLLQKSKEVLQVKSKLYDKLQSGESVQRDVGDPYLVDFKEKLDKVFSDASCAERTDEVNDSPYESDSDDDGWVDYVDCLGRTRRCLKEDMKIIKDRDSKMNDMLHGSDAVEESNSTEIQNEPGEHQLEMVSSDMQREKMREKWEQQEQLLLNKKNIYYEDIRFDEARTHGVAYYGFSTDESKREEEQAELKRLREETAAKQREAQEAKNRRDSMKQARLIAARQRQRMRLGLPPLTADIQVEGNTHVKQEVSIPEEEETSAVDLEAALTRAAHVRPWDVGKDGVKQPAKVMTQEEWVEKKRDERPEEFAPPLTEVHHFKISKKKAKKRKYIQGNHSRKFDAMENGDEIPGPLPEPNWSTSFNLTKQNNEEESAPSRTGVSIPPPASFDYYTPSKRPTNSSKKLLGNSAKSMKESIEAGLEFLRQQSVKRDKLIEKKFPDY